MGKCQGEASGDVVCKILPGKQERGQGPINGDDKVDPVGETCRTRGSDGEGTA